KIMKSSYDSCFLWALAALAVFLGKASVEAQTFEVLYSFEPFGLDGDSPHGGLVQARDGNFYGTTFYGGTWDFGTVFKITPAGVLATLASFDGTTNDQHPTTTMVEAKDGNFYGATVEPSRIFKATALGALTIFGDP